MKIFLVITMYLDPHYLPTVHYVPTLVTKYVAKKMKCSMLLKLCN